MEEKKFLTVFAVFEKGGQQELRKIQQNIINNNKSNEKQTMDIPFHMSLGSFPIYGFFMQGKVLNKRKNENTI